MRSESETTLLLQQAGEIQFGMKTKVRRVREHTVEVARVSLSLRSGSDVYPREVVLAEGPKEVRDVVAESARRGHGRPVDVDELPVALRRRVREVIAEQEELGYDTVTVERIVLVSEDVKRIRYRRDERPWLDVWVGTAPARVLAYEHGPGTTGIARGWSPNARPPSNLRPRDQALYLLGFIVWFGWLALTLAY